MARILSVAAVVVGTLLGLGAVTFYALESSGVVIAETRAEDGSTRATHVWSAEPDGELWLEAGSPGNPWYADLKRDPRITLRTEAGAAEYRATFQDDPASRARVRAELERKYGWRDGWIGLLVDHTKSVVVRLDPPTP
jgi:hypothetical protein